MVAGPPLRDGGAAGVDGEEGRLVWALALSSVERHHAFPASRRTRQPLCHHATGGHAARNKARKGVTALRVVPLASFIQRKEALLRNTRR